MANITLKACRLNMLGLHMPGESGAVLGLVTTVSASPHPIRLSGHLGLDSRHKLILKDAN